MQGRYAQPDVSLFDMRGTMNHITQLSHAYVRRRYRKRTLDIELSAAAGAESDSVVNVGRGHHKS